MATGRKGKPKIVRNGAKVEPSTLALAPFPPPNPGSDLIELREEVGGEIAEKFASRYISPEELEYLRTATKGKALTSDEKIAILEMSVAGLEPTTIAARIGRDPSTVRNFLTRYRPKNTIAKAYLEANSDKLAKRIIKSANVEEAIEVLGRIDVLPKPLNAPVGNTQFNIVVGSAAGGPSIPSQAQIEAAKDK